MEQPSYCMHLQYLQTLWLKTWQFKNKYMTYDENIKLYAKNILKLLNIF